MRTAVCFPLITTMIRCSPVIVIVSAKISSVFLRRQRTGQPPSIIGNNPPPPPHRRYSVRGHHKLVSYGNPTKIIIPWYDSTPNCVRFRYFRRHVAKGKQSAPRTYAEYTLSMKPSTCTFQNEQIYVQVTCGQKCLHIQKKKKKMSSIFFFFFNCMHTRMQKRFFGSFDETAENAKKTNLHRSLALSVPSQRMPRQQTNKHSLARQDNGRNPMTSSLFDRIDEIRATYVVCVHPFALVIVQSTHIRDPQVPSAHCCDLLLRV